MSQYTTGDMARLCEVSVRTVQFYDAKGILPPTELSEGGRRLFSEDDLARLRLICLLRSMGLSLDSIKGILESEAPAKVLLVLLYEHTKQIDAELDKLRDQKETVEAVRKSIMSGRILSVNSICDIESVMKGNKKLWKARAILLGVGILMQAAEIATILIWILRGIWWPFAAVMPIVILGSVLLVRMYYKSTSYICPECSARFKPAMKQFIFAAHTAKTRKLTCIACGKTGWCVETYAEKEAEK